ncbi:MAG TPA: peroxide stress protein YaaA [Rhodobacterales bacterium]|nr:peroxide stress protein YaaA [Rhodobacterales bacterium]
MLITVSPAKRLDETAPRASGGTVPRLLREAETLAETARGLTAPGLEKLMHISPKLAALNVDRFADFGSGLGEKQAIEPFAGDTYTGLDAASLDPEELDYAQRHLRILSGLYGVLRPRDVIQPHRLEMGPRLKNARGKNLYEFWGDRVAEQLNADAAEVGADVLVNCASVEYFTAADRPALKLRVITPVFMEDGPKGPRIMSFWAKQARGAMARYIVQNRLEDPEALKDFDAGGYQFAPELSEGDRLVFLRGEA